MCCNIFNSSLWDVGICTLNCSLFVLNGKSRPGFIDGNLYLNLDFPVEKNSLICEGNYI